MSSVRLTRLAQRQLSDVWEYSARTWGERQADKYLREINKVIERVVAGKLAGKPCEQYGAGFRRVRAESHHLYFRYDAEVDVYIFLAVLHQRMEPSRHLKDE